MNKTILAELIQVTALVIIIVVTFQIILLIRDFIHLKVYKQYISWQENLLLFIFCLIAAAFII